MNNMTVGSIRTTVTPPLTSGIYEALLEVAERERDEARDAVFRLRKQRAIARNFGEQMERERDEARNLADAAMWETDRLRAQLRKQRAT